MKVSRKTLFQTNMAVRSLLARKDKVSRKTLFQTNMAVRSLLARKDGSTKLGQELVSRLFAILHATEPYVEFQDLRRRAIAGACGLKVNSQTGAIAPDDQADNPEQAV